MQGDYTRFTFNPAKHYNRVLMQQGRVQLDADWNEQADLLAYRVDTLNRDVVGYAGGPAGSSGFRLRSRAALLFDGSDQYAAPIRPQPFDFPGRRPFTIESWVCPQGWEDPEHRGIVGGPAASKTDGRNLRGYSLSLDREGRVVFSREEIWERRELEIVVEEIKIGSLKIIEIEIIDEEQRVRVCRKLRSRRRLARDRFTHVAVTFDGQETRIYVNARLSALSRRSGDGVASEAPFLIGAQPRDEELRSFKGLIGETRIWNRARTEKEIRRRMNRLPRRRDLHLVARYRFRGRSRKAARDSSGNRNNALLGSDFNRPVKTGTLWIGRGRYYVDGILAQNNREVRFGDQPDYPIEPHLTSGWYLAYLDVWNRGVIALSDPNLREVALGGPDTTTRLQTVAQVKMLALGRRCEEKAPERIPEWLRFLRSRRDAGRLRAGRKPSDAQLGNDLYRVEIHFGGRMEARVRSAERMDGHPKMLKVDFGKAPWRAGDAVEIIEEANPEKREIRWAALVNPQKGTLTLDAPPSVDGPLRIRRPTAFKWSRDDGAVTLGIAKIHRESGEVVLQNVGDDEWAVKPGDWVELVNDQSQFLNWADPLCQVREIDHVQRKVKLSNLNQSRVTEQGHPFLRRWDQHGPEVDPATGVVPLKRGWIELEKGIHVNFSRSGVFRTSDYWVIPARTVTGQVEWPKRSDDQPAFRPPAGIRHHYAPLALVRVHRKRAVVARSFHRTFPSLIQELGVAGHEFVKKTGDTMTGPLHIDPRRPVEESLSVKGDARISGDLDVGRLSGEGVVGTEQIRDGAVDEFKLRDFSVARDKIQDGAVAEDKIRDGALTTRKLRDESITTPKLHTDAVTTPKIRDRSVTRRKLAFDIEPLPDGSCLLRKSPHPLPGYRFTGFRFSLFQPLPTRRDDRQDGPQESNLSAVAAGEFIYAFAEWGDIWRLEPDSGRWERMGARLEPARKGFAVAAVRLPESVEDPWRIFAVGGIDRQGKIVSDNIEYNPHRDRCFERARMKTARAHLAAAALQHQIYALGGEESAFLGRRTSRLCERYDPVEDRWHAAPSMPTSRSHLAAVPYDGFIYAIGGERRLLHGWLGKVTLRANEAYQHLGAWTRLQSMLHRRSRLGGAALRDQIFVLGGRRSRLLGLIKGRKTATDQEYLPEWREWRENPEMMEARSSFNAAAVQDVVFAVGGAHPRLGRRGVAVPIVSVYYVFEKV